MTKWPKPLKTRRLKFFHLSEWFRLFFFWEYAICTKPAALWFRRPFILREAGGHPPADTSSPPGLERPSRARCLPRGRSWGRDARWQGICRGVAFCALLLSLASRFNSNSEIFRGTKPVLINPNNVCKTVWSPLLAELWPAPPLTLSRTRDFTTEDLPVLNRALRDFSFVF